jgi:hypothetical protein
MDELINKIHELRTIYSKDQQRKFRLDSVEQFANILYNLPDDKSIVEKHIHYLKKYVSSLHVSSGNLSDDYIDKNKEKYYFPVLRFLGSKSYYRGGWIGVNLLVGIPFDLTLYLLDVFGDIFIPVLTVAIFGYKQIDYFIKKKKNRVLIEDR